LRSSRERALAAINLEEPDRTPIFELLINAPIASKVLGRPSTGLDKLESVRLMIQGKRDMLVKAAAEDQVSLYDQLGLDIIRSGLCLAERYTPPKEIGPREFLYVDDHTGFYRKVRYSPESDMMTEYESTIGESGLPALEEYVRRLEAERFAIDGSELEAMEHTTRLVKGRLLVSGSVDGTFPVSHATWLSIFLRSLYADPGLIHRLFKESTRRAVETIKALVDSGAELIVGGADWGYGKGPFVSPRHFHEFILPSLRAHVEACHKLGVPFIKHTDGNMTAVQDMFLGESGVDGYHAIEPRAGMDIARLKQEYGDRVCLLGNVDCAHTLVFGSVKDVVAETKRCIQAASPGGGHVLSSSNSIHAGVRLCNFLAMIEAGKRYGSQPSWGLRA